MPVYQAGLCTLPGTIKRSFKAKFGWDISFEEIRHLGAKVLDLEREFNERAGVSKSSADTGIHEEEPLPQQYGV